MKKICFVTAVPGTARVFLKNHMKNLMKDYEVYLVCNCDDTAQIEELNLTGFKCIHIIRKINLKADLAALKELKEYFSLMNFDAVHSVTPKAGLLSAIAAKLVKVPNRIHIFTGQVWATRKGLMKRLLMWIDKLIVKLDSIILVDGYSQQAFLEDHKIIKKGQSQVLGLGSICGVDLSRFSPDTSVRNENRDSLCLPNNTVVFSFMGRMTKEKGVYELLSAFDKLILSKQNAFLLLIGKDEDGVVEKLNNYENLNRKNVYYYGLAKHPELILQVSDIFCLPSYREGFGMSALEAQGLGIPVICSDAYGLKDTIVDGKTGLRCKVGDISSLYDCMLQLYDNPSLRKHMGEKARERVMNDFSSNTVEKAWKVFYDNLLSSYSKE